MSKITLQEIFDNAWQAFIVEKRPPAIVTEHNDRRCYYETPDGRNCAIGITLKKRLPEDVFIEIAGKNEEFALIVEQYPEYFDDEMSNLYGLELDYFQSSLHDENVWDENSDNVSNKTGDTWFISLEELEKKYIKIAKSLNLNIPNQA